MTARNAELQELMKQHRLEQLQLSELLQQFPNYVVVVNAEDSTILRVSPAYQQLLRKRKAAGLPLSELFSGNDLDDLVKLLQKAVREKQTVRTPAIDATVPGIADSNSRLVHTIVPILDETGTHVDRLFIYSDKAERYDVGGGGESRVASHDVVTLTDCVLQHFSLFNVKLAATVFNRLQCLQGTGRDRDAGTASTKAAGDHFLSQTQVGATDAIVEHQKPAAEPVHDRVPGVANTALRYLRHQRSIKLEYTLECLLVLKQQPIQQLGLELHRMATHKHPKPLP